MPERGGGTTGAAATAGAAAATGVAGGVDAQAVSTASKAAARSAFMGRYYTAALVLQKKPRTLRSGVEVRTVFRKKSARGFGEG
jgi:hypothetical protein